MEGLASEVLVGADVPMHEQGSELSLSVLDLCPVLAGGSAADALRRSLDLARHTEKLGYHRYWVAEHHSMPGIASAATSMVIGHIAGGTSTIRVGSGGIMLLNHAPLVIAEQFGTLESLYPGRIDLGLGRAPGTDQATMRLLRRNLDSTGEEFPQKLEELRSLLKPASPNSVFALCREPGSKSRSGSWDPAGSVRNSLANSDCPSPQRAIFRPITSFLDSNFIDGVFAHRRTSTSPARWLASTSLPQRRTRKRSVSRHRIFRPISNSHEEFP